MCHVILHSAHEPSAPMEHFASYELYISIDICNLQLCRIFLQKFRCIYLVSFSSFGKKWCVSKKKGTARNN